MQLMPVNFKYTVYFLLMLLLSACGQKSLTASSMKSALKNRYKEFKRKVYPLSITNTGQDAGAELKPKT